MLVDNVNDITVRKEILLTLWGDDSFFNTRDGQMLHFVSNIPGGQGATCIIANGKVPEIY